MAELPSMAVREFIWRNTDPCDMTLEDKALYREWGCDINAALPESAARESVETRLIRSLEQAVAIKESAAREEPSECVCGHAFGQHISSFGVLVCNEFCDCERYKPAASPAGAAAQTTGAGEHRRTIRAALFMACAVARSQRGDASPYEAAIDALDTVFASSPAPDARDAVVEAATKVLRLYDQWQDVELEEAPHATEPGGMAWIERANVASSAFWGAFGHDLRAALAALTPTGGDDK